MIDKKIVLAIIAFALSGLIAYSFANPIENVNVPNNSNTSSDLNEENKSDEEILNEDELLDEENNEESNDSTDDLLNEENNIVNGTTNESNNMVNNSTNNSNSNVINKPNNNTVSNNTTTKSENNTNNSENESENDSEDKPLTPEIIPVVKKEGASFKHIKYVDEISQIKVSKNENTIEFTGEVNEQKEYYGYTNYIKFRILSNDVVTNEELSNANVTIYSSAAGTTDLTGEIKIDSQGFAYVDCEYVFQKTNDGNVDLEGNPTNYDKLIVSVNWGFGETISYTIFIKLALVEN